MLDDICFNTLQFTKRHLTILKIVHNEVSLYPVIYTVSR